MWCTLIWMSVFSQTQYHLLWLNPPYGDRISDQVMGAKEAKTGRDRLEKHFFSADAFELSVRRFIGVHHPALCFG